MLTSCKLSTLPHGFFIADVSIYFFFHQEVSIILMSFGSKKQVKNYNIKTYARDQNYVG